MISTYNFISIIIPCLNNEKTIEKCIKSLLKQSYPLNYFEIIIVDNGSTDESISIVQDYPVTLLREKIRNPYIARNLGALHANGNILAFTDSNCEIDRNWLLSINNIINTNVDVSQGPGYLTNQNSLLPKAESKRLFMNENCFWGDAKNLAIKKVIFFKVNGFFEYHTGCDSLLIEQLKSLGFNVKYNNDQLVYPLFSEQLLVLFKKNWKYGMGDINIDFFANKSNKLSMFKRIIITSHKKLLKMLLKSKTSEDIYIIIYFYIISEIRNISYILNYNSVINKIKSIQLSRSKTSKFKNP